MEASRAYIRFRDGIVPAELSVGVGPGEVRGSTLAQRARWHGAGSCRLLPKPVSESVECRRGGVRGADPRAVGAGRGRVGQRSSCVYRG